MSGVILFVLTVITAPLSATAAGPGAGSGLGAKASTKPAVFEVSVTEKGFEPNRIQARAGESVTLKITRRTEQTCSTEVQIPAMKIKKTLPLNETVSIELPLLAKGDIRFGCGMNMMDGGVIAVQ